MKKIIIVNNNLKTGGVQISLLNLLKEIHGLYDVTLLLFSADPEELKLIPENVKVIVDKSPFSNFGISFAESKHSFKSLISRTFWTIITKIFGRSFAIRLMSPFTKTYEGYDCAISYLHEGSQKSVHGGCNEFVLKKIKAKKKITWLHCDFGLCGANHKKNIAIYHGFDTIVACSQGTKNAFVSCVPDLESKCVVIRNCNDYAAIQRLSQPAAAYPQNTFNIVTVARLSPEKGIDRMLRALSVAKSEGHRVTYHVVGMGREYDTLKQLADTLSLSENVVFHGNQTNPYPYIAAADLFVLPSYHEAAPMVFDEAASLGIPVLATETTSAHEMITKEHAGFVCPNSQEGIAEALLSILREPASLKTVSERLKAREFHNQKSISTILNTF